ncbi:MAG: dimethyl sulfoxide reductase anchor subunit family protein, partial [Paracoccaceae bacterium]
TALVTAGLISSTLHLGHPERAIKAFSQWRSSWLSREGVAAVATYVPMVGLGLIWLLGLSTGLVPVLALLVALGAVVTVYCTGMIYASLPTIRQWHRGDVPIIYLLLAAGTGGALMAIFAKGFGLLGGIALLIALAGKAMYWIAIDRDPGKYTAEMAFGMPDMGAPTPLDPPHTQPNFVMREMGYTVARKHAQRLRTMAMGALFGAAVLAAFGLPMLAVVAAGVGVWMERWLFFAEAEHVSMLYYGAKRA